MKKSATNGFTKTVKPGLTWPIGGYAPGNYNVQSSQKPLSKKLTTKTSEFCVLLYYSSSLPRFSMVRDH